MDFGAGIGEAFDGILKLIQGLACCLAVMVAVCFTLVLVIAYLTLWVK